VNLKTTTCDERVRGLGHGALLRIVERLLAQYAAVVEQ
jgi:hypothetical protein